MTLTEALKEIKDRVEKATPGPWKWNRGWKPDPSSKTYDGFMGELKPDVLWYGMDGEEGIYCNNKFDSELIAHAPTDITRLLSALELAIEQRDSALMQDDDVYWDLDEKNNEILKRLKGEP